MSDSETAHARTTPGPPRAVPTLTRRVLRNVLVPLALSWMVGAVIALVIANSVSYTHLTLPTKA